MVISRKHKFVFISTPKTGTHSLYHTLQEHFECERYGEDYHENTIPLGCGDYFKFTTIRNPYDRLVSAWNSLLFTDEYRDEYISLIGNDTFEALVKWAWSNKRNLPYMGVRGLMTVVPQSTYLRGMKIDKYLKIENIDEELSNLHFVDSKIKVHKLLHRKHKQWSELKNKTILKFANDFLKEDFEMFDYQMERK